MKRTSCHTILLAILFLIVTHSHGVCRDPNNTIVIGTESSYPPYSFSDKNNKPTGYNADLIREIAKATGLDIEIRLAPWNEIRQALLNGEIDAIAGMYYSGERDKQFDFSQPFTLVHHSAFVRKKDRKILGENDLKDKEIIVMNGDIMHDYLLQKDVSKKIYPVPGISDALRLLASGKHDCALVATLPGHYRLREMKLKNVVTSGPLMQPYGYSFAVKNNNDSLLHLLGEGLAITGENGRHQEVYNTWLGILQKPQIQYKKGFKTILLAVIILLFLFSASVLWLRSLRQQVLRHTSEIRKSEKHLNRVNHILWVIRKVNQFLVQEKDSFQLIKKTCDLLIKNRDYGYAWILLMEEKKHYCAANELLQTSNSFSSLIEQGKLPACAEKALKTNEMLIVENTKSDCGNCPYKDIFPDGGSLTMVLSHEKITLGLLSVSMKKEFLHDKDEQSLFQEVAGDLSFALHNMEMEKKRKRSEKILTLVYNIANATNKTPNLEDLIVIIERELSRLINTKNFYIALYDKENDKLSLPFFQDEKDEFTDFPPRGTLTHYVLKTNKPLYADQTKIAELEKEGEIEKYGSDTLLWLGVPLHVRGRINGVMAVQSYEDAKAFTLNDLYLLEAVSDQVGISVERKKHEEDLIKAKIRAEESDALKTAFLANMSHEIRTPMNGILGFTGLLKLPGLTAENKEKYIAIIEKSGKRMLDTINDIIDISKIEARQVELYYSELSLLDLCAEIFSFFRLEAESKGLKLEYHHDLDEQDTVIVTDKNKLKAILINLIKNAIKYTEKGNINLSCRRLIAEDKKYMQFFVEDTGIGIPKSRLNAIFNRFEQADISDSRAHEGSGLGLAISKSYVEMLGGQISVSSVEGKGSIFSFSIEHRSKIDLNLKRVEKKHEALHGYLLKNLSLIVAEDDEISRELFELIFKNKFRKIIYTQTGRKTIEAIRDKPETDLILMDIKMPDLNGYEATQEIRKFNKKVIIIAQTAFGFEGDREKALSAGCDDYISKPIKKKDLIMLIEKQLLLRKSQ